MTTSNPTGLDWIEVTDEDGAPTVDMAIESGPDTEHDVVHLRLAPGVRHVQVHLEGGFIADFGGDTDNNPRTVDGDGVVTQRFGTNVWTHPDA